MLDELELEVEVVEALVELKLFEERLPHVVVARVAPRRVARPLAVNDAQLAHKVDEQRIVGRDNLISEWDLGRQRFGDVPGRACGAVPSRSSRRPTTRAQRARSAAPSSRRAC